MKKLFSFTIAGAIASSLLLSSCHKKDHEMENPVKKPDIIFYGLTADNQLVKYNAKSPEMAIGTIAINGLESGEKIMAIDFRPATGQLYGVGKSSRIYSINAETGKALVAGTAPFTPAISGDMIGFDFNPTVDRIRLVTNAGQNLRLNPETGTVAAEDKMLNPGTPSLIGAAYTNSFAGASSTTLFDIDLSTQKLVKQSPPNDGVLVEVGSLGVTATGEGGFDISPDNKVALASLTVGDKNGLYTVDTATGKVTKLGIFSMPIIGLAIPTNPVAYATDESNNLHIFNFTKVGTPVSKPITGLQTDEKILGIDMRPATGQLYAVGSTFRIYTINMASGAATAVSATPFISATVGTFFGVDFNPTVDRIRVVSDKGENFRIHPVTGVLAFTDGMLNPGMPDITGAAYTNNFADAASTVLFDIDCTADKLYTQTPPNDGVLVEVGSLGLDIESSDGFDIGGVSGKAYGLFKLKSGTKIYSVNLMTGAATAVSDFPVAATGFALGLGF